MILKLTVKTEKYPKIIRAFCEEIQYGDLILDAPINPSRQWIDWKKDMTALCKQTLVHETASTIERNVVTQIIRNSFKCFLEKKAKDGEMLPELAKGISEELEIEYPNNITPLPCGGKVYYIVFTSRADRILNF